MQAQEKKIKGFNLLELLVVIVIIGVVSAAAYPNFSSWQKERKAKDAATQIKELVVSINAQVKRGLYAFVQVYFNETDDGLEIISKGMRMDNLSSRINNSAGDWHKADFDRCNTTIAILMETEEDDGTIVRNETGYWDDWGGTSNKPEVRKLLLDAYSNVGEGAVCFSKNGNYYFGSGDLGDEDFIPDDSITICSQNCILDDAGFPNSEVYAKRKAFAYRVLWTRFGEVSLEKWMQKMDGDLPGTGVFVEQ